MPYGAARDRDDYRGRVRRLLAPRWLLGHAVVLVLAVLFLRLGWWQWHRAVDTRSAQSLGYALQWPFFAAFGVLVWVRICRDVTRPPETVRPVKPQRRPAPEPAPAAPVTDEEDPELAAYNRYLAELNERPA
jgi:DNA-binding transcriptional regulator of glucitol operon